MRMLSCKGSVAAPVFALVLALPAAAQDFKSKCEGLAAAIPAAMITQAAYSAAGPQTIGGAQIPLPEHCAIQGKLNPRKGIDGRDYAIGYEMRLPAGWNGKFLFQGGGGADGVLRPALGVHSGATPVFGLTKGYAVTSTDAGHQIGPGLIGPYLFGLDPQARFDKAQNSIPVVAHTGRAVIEKFYGRAPQRAYFTGCSNGGRQGMKAAQVYPDLFDGIIAGAPAYRVPLAAIDGIGHTKMLAAIAPKLDNGQPDLGSSLTPDDLKFVADAILSQCDAADGAKDGMVSNPAACKFDPAAIACKPGQNSACIAPAKAEAIGKMHQGTRNSKGEVLYSTWAYDPGIAVPSWGVWRIGTPRAFPPNARNVTLIPGSVAYYFSTPPNPVTDLYDYVMKYDLDRDVAKIHATNATFTQTGWQLEGAPFTDVDAFKARGGKLLFFHGIADPIFSALDTMKYVDDLKARYGGGADGFARLFLVPGMTHCSGGPSTDRFELLDALDAWVERNQAPETILATARQQPEAPFPGRTRPLCPYPKYSHYKGAGSIEDAASFECR